MCCLITHHYLCSHNDIVGLFVGRLVFDVKYLIFYRETHVILYCDEKVDAHFRVIGEITPGVYVSLSPIEDIFNAIITFDLQ